MKTKDDEILLSKYVIECDGNANQDGLVDWWEAQGFPLPRLEFILNKWHKKGWSSTLFTKVQLTRAGFDALKGRTA